jgi:hypothetical protein
MTDLVRIGEISCTLAATSAKKAVIFSADNFSYNVKFIIPVKIIITERTRSLYRSCLDEITFPLHSFIGLILEIQSVLSLHFSYVTYVNYSQFKPILIKQRTQWIEITFFQSSSLRYTVSLYDGKFENVCFQLYLKLTDKGSAPRICISFMVCLRQKLLDSFNINLVLNSVIK